MGLQWRFRRNLDRRIWWMFGCRRLLRLKTKVNEAGFPPKISENFRKFRKNPENFRKIPKIPDFFVKISEKSRKFPKKSENFLKNPKNSENYPASFTFVCKRSNLLVSQARRRCTAGAPKACPKARRRRVHDGPEARHDGIII